MPLTFRPRYVPRVKAHRVYPKKKRSSFVKKVKRVLKRTTETKLAYDRTAYADLETASQRIIHLTNIAQGDNYNNRTGNVIEPFRLKANISVKAVAAVSPCVVRTTLVKFKTCDGTAPTLSDIFPASGGVSLNYLEYELPLAEYKSYQQAGRKFQILYDKIKTISYATADSPCGRIMFRINKKLTGKTFYTDTAGTDEGNNQLYLFVHTNAADNVIQEAHETQLHFKDA